MASRGYKLLENGSATGDWVQVTGGRMAVVVEGTLATTSKLQMQGLSGAAIDIDATLALGMTILDLPDGKYRTLQSGGTPASIYVSMSNIKYY